MKQILLIALSGISYGMVLFLISIGLSMFIGLMGVVNLAHGAVFVVGGYIGITVAEWTGNFLLGVLTGALSSGIIGLVMERGFLRFLAKQFLEQVLITLGFVYVLINANDWIWGPTAKGAFVPPFLAGSIYIGESRFPVHRLAITIIGALICLALWWFQERTRIGSIIRAGMDNAEMTSGLGINLKPINIGVFFFGSSLAGLAAIIGGPLLGSISTIAVWDILWLALAVCIVGGMGSVQGAVAGALLIGIFDAFGRAYFAGFAMFTPYIVMVIVLVIRPSGLMGRKI